MNHYDVLMAAHVLGGALGLFSMAIPLVAKKGGNAHKKAGWIFTAGMALAAFSGLAVTALWLAAPLTYKPATSTDPAALAKHLERIQTGAVFLGTLAILTLNSLWIAIRAFKRKRAPKPDPSFVDVALPSLLLFCGIGVMIYGVAHSAILLCIFALIEIGTAIGDLRFVLLPLASPMAWWYQHMNAMMGAVIAALTAFLVFNGQRILGPELAKEWSIALWVGPSAIIVPCFTVWIRRYKRKFRETGSRETVAADKVTA